MVGPLEIQNEAFRVAQIYLRYMKRYSRRSFNLKTVKNSKAWPHFVRLTELHINKPEWNADKFIEFVFDQYGPLYPAQMKTQEIWKEFIGANTSISITEEKNIALELLNSFKMVKRWCDRNKVFFSVPEYIEQPKNRIFVKRGGLSPLFISISKSLTEYVESLPEKDRNAIIDGELKNKRMVVHRSKRISEKMKEILKDDFI